MKNFIISLLFCTSTVVYAGNPQEVRKFLSKKEMCEHWSGEEPYDKERAQEIKEGIKKSCKGLDKQEKHLKQKYRNNKEIYNLLSQ